MGYLIIRKIHKISSHHVNGLYLSYRIQYTYHVFETIAQNNNYLNIEMYIVSRRQTNSYVSHNIGSQVIQ